MAGTRLGGGGRSSGRTELEREFGVVGGDLVAAVTPRQADRIYLRFGFRDQRRMCSHGPSPELTTSLRGGIPPARAIRRAPSRCGGMSEQRTRRSAVTLP
jgi:hypothetical protein